MVMALRRNFSFFFILARSLSLYAVVFLFMYQIYQEKLQIQCSRVIEEMDSKQMAGARFPSGLDLYENSELLDGKYKRKCL